MPITADINPGETWLIAGKGLFVFEEEEANCILKFRRDGTSFAYRMPEHEFWDRVSRNRIEKVVFDKKGEPIERQEVGPGEVWTIDDVEKMKLTPEGRRALALQYVTMQWDKDDKATRGDGGLGKLIAKCRPHLINEGLELFLSKEDIEARKKRREKYKKSAEAEREIGLRVEVAALRRAINNCGIRGHRPLSAFMSQSGKGPRQRYDDIVEDLLKRTVSLYWENRSVDYDDAYSFFTEMDKINAERKRRNLPEIVKFPDDPEIIRRRIQKNRCALTWATRHGPKAARKKFKGQADHIDATWPLELCMIDSTPLDTFLAHKKASLFVVDTRTCLPLGRPWLTVCLDVATRMPLGFLITFEAPSVYSALTTLKRSIRPKRYMKKMYPHITREWDGFGPPVELLLDNTWENKAPSLKSSLRNVGIELHWAPIKSPEYKSIMERFFRTCNTGLYHKLPGGVPYPPYLMKQVGLDPQKDFIISLDEINALTHEFFVQYIHDKHEGLGAVPARVWHDKLMINRRRVIRTDALDHILGKVSEAVLTPSGITYRGMEFHDREAVSSLLDDLVKETKIRSQSPREAAPSRVNVLIVENSADAGSISAWNDVAKDYVARPNRDPEFFKGLSFFHAEQIREHCERLDLDFSSKADRWKGRDSLRRNIEKLMRKKPMRQTRDARRMLGSYQDSFDEIEDDTTETFGAGDIVDLVAEPSTTGMNKPEPVPDELAYKLLKDNTVPKGRTPSRKSIDKAKRTKKANLQEAREAEHGEAVKRQRGDPTGETEARSTKVIIKPPTGPGWSAAQTPTEPKDAAAKSPGLFAAKGPGWGSNGRQT
ncbi:DDE-type integrase/transposase/recombinase [Bradyrhizobium barranii subsp. barranii]|uniref:DDE-type integrase/transposase/recombinase n=1 Tax=Bradyrhizobium barranii subsp. barranii TaxID=2823807 RepID=A0A7Z0Q772_9BRAD|nr:DDE-type integrase/transposase/recombinase [Bradyrhizobium barranii]UGX94813.1 DDE-type integrase/transposase/recombinase [Bradyrhizobium barranii subsp. barranii]